MGKAAVVLVIGVLLGACAEMTPRTAPQQPWGCLPSETASTTDSIYVLESQWPRVGAQVLRRWGVDLEERGPTQIIRLDAATGATRARTSELGVGAAPGPMGVARFVPAMPARLDGPITGIEILDAQNLTRRGFVATDALRDRTRGSFKPGADSLAAAAVVLIDADRVALVHGPTIPPGETGSSAPPGIDAICVDARMGIQRIGLRASEDGLSPCGVPPQIRTTPERFYIAYPLCGRSRSVAEAEPILRIFAIEGGKARFFDVPFRRSETPIAVSHDGRRIYAANPLTQEAYALNALDGSLIWQVSYGVRPNVATPAKLAPAPNQVLVDQRDDRIYIATNPETALSRGVYVLDRDGRTLTHAVPDVSVAGMAVLADGNLLVATPEGGGQLLVLSRERSYEPRLLRGNLGDGVSGVAGGI